MKGMFSDTRPQRYGWAPGGYMNRCHASGCASKSDEDRIFIGDKRAIICADCAYAMPDPLPEPPFEVRLRAQVTDLLRRARQLEIELEKWEKGK